MPSVYIDKDIIGLQLGSNHHHPLLSNMRGVLSNTAEINISAIKLNGSHVERLSFVFIL